MAAMSLCVSGCGGAVALNANFPAPLTTRLPLTAAVQYPQELRSFTHEEVALDSTRWTVALGAPCVRMLESVFGAAFTVIPPNLSAASPDLIIEPEILRFEFGVPGRSKVDVPAAWIEFNVRIKSGDGAPLTRLTIPGYGEGSQGGGVRKRLSEAAEYALRDAGAALSQELLEDAAILALMGSRS
ncbi:hypothetical protein [Candidatus Foliamicus sp.]